MGSEPPENNSTSTAKLYTDRHSGTLYTPIHGNRHVKIYAIQEHELTAIGICNTFTAVFSSVASMSLTAMLACAWDMILLASAGSQIPQTAWLFAGFFVIIAIASVACAVVSHKSKKSMIDRIKEETDRS